MPRRTPQQAAERWSRAMANAGTNYTEGVQSVQTAPGESAARNAQGYVNGVNQAAASGKWQRRVAAVPLETWKSAAINKGAARLAQGAAQAVDKVRQANERVFPMIDQATSRIANMPRSTPQERIARATAYMTAMSEIANRNTGR